MSSKKTKTVKNNISKTNPKNQSENKKAEITKNAKQYSKKSLDKKALRLYILSFLVPFIVAIVGLVMGGFAPFGSKDIMTASGHESMIPFYHELYDRFHNGTVLAYNYNNGYDFSKVFLYYMSDPLNLIMLILPKSAMFGCMSILYAIKIGLSGLFASIFFKYRKAIAMFNKVEMENERAEEIAEYESKLKAKRDKAREKNKNKKDFKIGGSEAPKTKFGTWLANLDIYTFVLAVSYALSSYMITEGANIAYTGAVALFPLVLLGIERLIAEKHWLTYVIAFTLTIYANIYIAMIEFVFMLIYVPTRDYHSLKEGIEICLKKIVLDILAVGAGFVVVLNSFTSSVFLNEFTLHFPDYHPVANIGDSFSEMMFSAVPSYINSFNNNADLYAGILLIFFTVIYLFNSNIKSSSRLKNTIIMIILFIGTIFPTANHLFNAFKNSPYFYTTFGYIFIIMLLISAQEALANIEYTKTLHVLISFLIIIFFTVYSMMFSTSYDGPNPYLYTMEIVSLYFIVTLMWKNNSMTKLVFETLIGIIFICEVCFIFPKSLSILGSTAKEYNITKVSNIEKASEYIKEKYDNSKKSLIVYYENNRTNIEPVSEMLCGVKYVIAKKDTANMDFNLEKIDTIDEMDIYENKYSLDGCLSLDELPSDILCNYYTLPYESINELVDYILINVQHEAIYQAAPIISKDIKVAQFDIYNKDGTLVTKENTYQYELGQSLSGNLYGYTDYIVHAGESYPFNETTTLQKLTLKEDNSIVFNQRYYVLNKDTYISLFNYLTNNNTQSNNSRYIEMFRHTDQPFSSYWIVFSMFIVILSAFITVLTFKNKRQLDSTFLKDLFTGHILTISHFLSRYRTIIINLVFTAGLFVSFLMIRGIMPFGSRMALISDSYLVYYHSLSSTFVGLLGRLNSLKLEYISFSSLLFSGGKLPLELYLNPINWPLILFPEEYSIQGVTLIFFLRFILTGPTFIFYLTHRYEGKLSLSDSRLIPASIAYSTCTFFTGYFIYYVFFDIALALPFTIYALEGLIFKKDVKKYVIIMSITMLINMFQAFQLCEFILLYFFTFKFEDIKDFFIKGIRFALSSILSALIAGYSLFPLFKSLLDSAYLLGNESNMIASSSVNTPSVLPDINLNNTFFSSFKNLMVMTKAILVENDFSRANSYAGILLLFFLIAFLLNKRIHIYQRISRFLLMLLLYFSYGNELLNYVFHGFHKQVKVPNRFSIFLIFMVIVAFVDSFYTYTELKKKTAYTALGASTIIIILMSIISHLVDKESLVSASVLLTIAFTIVYTIVITLSIKQNNNTKPFKKKSTLAILTVLLAAELLITNLYSAPPIYGRDIPTIQNSNRYISAITKEKDYKKNIERVELFSTGQVAELVNNQGASNTYGISAFSSTISTPYITTLNFLNIPTYRNFILYGNGNPISNTFLNIKAQAADSLIYKGTIPNYMNEVSSVGTVKMYESPYNLALGFNIPDDKSINDLNYSEYDNVCDYHNEISKRITGEEIYDTYRFIYKSSNDKYNTINNSKEFKWYIKEPNTIEDKDLLIKSTVFEYTVDHDPHELRQITSNNTTITVHIPKGITGDIYIGNKHFINYITSTNGNTDTYIDLPFFYYVIPGKSERECIEEQLNNYQIAILKENVLSKFHDNLINGCIRNINKESTTISGDITINEPGTIYFSLPKLDGFTAYIDGKRVDTVEYFGGLGIPVKKTGEHHIELKYHVSGLIEGIIMTLSGIVIFIIVLFVQNKLTQRKKTKFNNE